MKVNLYGDGLSQHEEVAQRDGGHEKLKQLRKNISRQKETWKKNISRLKKAEEKIFSDKDR
jgi:hypothetical protein